MMFAEVEGVGEVVVDMMVGDEDGKAKLVGNSAHCRKQDITITDVVLDCRYRGL